MSKLPFPLVAIEEHVSFPVLAGMLDHTALARAGWPRPGTEPTGLHKGLLLLPDIAEQRLAAMNRNGITVQILSMPAPPPELASAGRDVEYASAANDALAAIIDRWPDRFAAFACLPAHRPEEAARELERAVRKLQFKGALISGSVQGRFLDDECFRPLLAASEALAVPIFLHPGMPPPAVTEAYYSGLPGVTGFILGTYGWGWHSEVALHVLRLVISGTLEKYPRLKLIVGHLGEGLPSMIERIDESFAGSIPHLTKAPGEIMREHLHIATSGFLSRGAFHTLVDTFGINRILFATDYPFLPIEQSVEFLAGSRLTVDQLRAICWKNAAALFGLRIQDSTVQI